MTAISPHQAPTGCDKVPLADQCVALCEHCLQLIDAQDEVDHDFAVHEMRVATKRLRAAWHLVKRSNPALAKQRRKSLRALSGEIAGMRDQAVLLELAKSLAEESGDADDDAFTSLIDGLEKSQPADPQAAEDVFPPTLREGWREELETWRSLDLGDADAQRRLIRRALRASQRDARHRSKEALDHSDAELWHEWRKAVKRLRYQREFVAASQGRSPGTRHARITKLGTRLGERNDLANLLAVLDDADSELKKALRGRIHQAIAKREHKIIRHARRLGRLAFLR